MISFLLAKFWLLPLIVVALAITLKLIINWFRQRQSLKQSDKNNIAFTIKQQLDTGNYVVYQGIFNKQNEELLDGQKLAGKVDQELEEIHQGKELVIYN